MRVCVIGAGPSGLTTIKQLLDEGHNVQCYEKSNNIGGIWQRSANPGDDANDMKVFDSLILTISMRLMSYSDFMVEKDRVFYTHRAYREYLEAYSEKFGLRRHIQLSAPVTKVERTASRGYLVSVSVEGTIQTREFDAVAVCSGPFQTPETSSVPDIGRFTGDVVHSSTYRNNQKFKGKRVMVVGLAESGADIAREVSDVASECTLSIRSYSFLIPRVHNGVYATDATNTRLLFYDQFVRCVKGPFPLPTLIGDSRPTQLAVQLLAWFLMVLYYPFRELIRLLSRQGREDSRSGLNVMGEPAHPLKLDIGCEWTPEHTDAINEWNKKSHGYKSNWTQNILFSKNVSFIPNLVNGKLKVNDSGVDKIDGKRVIFKNGQSAEFDAIVLCTGFRKDFSALGTDLAVKDNNVRNLYKHAFHPGHGGRLAFIGFVRPYTGGIPIIAEMQARYFALLCSGKHRLPDDLEQRIQREKQWEDEQVSLSLRHPETIPSQCLFLDGIAREIGCLPTLSTLVLSPRLLIRLWFYPFNQACYRLTGPHSDPKAAAEEILRDAPPPNDLVGFLLLPLAFLPGFIHPKYVLFSRPRARDKR
jgi:hypothetical protein